MAILQENRLIGQDEELYPAEVRFNWKIALVAAIAGAAGAFVVYWSTTVMR